MKKQSPIQILSAALLFTGLFAPQLLPAQVTWSGAGTDANWSTGANWGGTSPIDGDALIFAGSMQVVNTNDISTLLSNAWVRFDAGGFNIKGNGLTLLTGITNLSGINQVGLGLNWSTNVRNFHVSSGTELIIAGSNTLAAGDHFYVGGGRLRLTGTHVQAVNPPATILNNIEYVVDGGSFSSGGGVRITSAPLAAACKLILTNNAVMNQTLSAGAIRVGDFSGVTATLIIDNSTLSAAGGNLFIPFGTNGIGVVNQNGGTNSGGDIAFCNNASGSGTYNMVGGLLEALRIRRVNTSGTTATISFDGSTLRPVAATPNAANFFTNMTSAEIKSGGLMVDNNGTDVTIGQSFFGSGGLTKNGAGTLTISIGTSSYAGGFTMNAGTVSLVANNAFGTGTLTINGGTMQPSASTTRSATNAVTLAGDYTAAGSANLTFSGPVTLTGDRKITSTTTHVMSGAIGETGGARSIIKLGSGALNITGTGNSYSGSTVISNGVIQIDGNSLLGNQVGALVLAGGTLRTSASRSVTTAPVGNPISLVDNSTVESSATAASTTLNFTNDTISTTAGTLTFRNSGAATNTFAPRFSGAGFNFTRPIALVDAGTNFVQLNFFNSNNVAAQTFSGEISGSGSLLRGNSTFGNGGQTILTASNSFTGGLTLNDGLIGIGNDYALSTGPVTVNGGGLFAHGAPRTVSRNLNMTGNFAIGGSQDIDFTGTLMGNGANRIFSVSNLAATTISGVITSTVGVSSTAWTKAGLGTLTIPVANLYAGDTAVTAGTLKVNNSTGSATGTGTVNVSSTGTLSGTGQVATITVIAGGRVAPGASVGTLNATNATFDMLGGYQVEISDANTNLSPGVGWDFLSLSGTLAITATSGNPMTIDVSSMGGLAANFANTNTYAWPIATAAGGITGFAADKFVVVSNNFLNPVGSKAFSVTTNGNSLVLLFGAATAVPQPQLTNIVGAGTENVQISWSSVAGASYTVQYKSNLTQASWLYLTNITASGSTATTFDNTTPAPPQRFYRVISP